MPAPTASPLTAHISRFIEVGCGPNDPMHAIGQHAFAIDGIAADGGEFIEVHAGANAFSGAGEHNCPNRLVTLC